MFTSTIPGIIELHGIFLKVTSEVTDSEAIIDKGHLLVIVRISCFPTGSLRQYLSTTRWGQLLHVPLTPCTGQLHCLLVLFSLG